MTTQTDSPINSSLPTAEALACFAKGYSCSQVVLMAYAEHYGLGSALVMRIATGLGGGVGRMGDTRGALIGTVLGLEYAPDEPDDAVANNHTSAASQAL